MYDEESGLYYLQSRYYDPVTGRFVNADGFVSTGTGLMGYNMFAYCNNNPVMYVDPTGARPVGEIQADIDALEAFINEARYAIANRTTSLNAEDMLHYAQQLSALKQELADALVVWPTDGSKDGISSPYGPRQNPFTGEMEHHNGIDITPLTYGNADPIYSSMSGSVIESGHHSSMGNYVKIQNAQYIITYMHMSKILIGSGDVATGDTIGFMGRSGSATGVHLHFEVWDRTIGSTINPMNLFD